MKTVSGTRPIGVGLIGYGYAGATFHAPLIEAVDTMKLTAVYSSRPQAVHTALPNVAVADGTAALCAHPAVELVVIASPNDSHATLAHQALEANKHVVVDKPFVTRSHDGEALIRLARERGKILSVFHNRRWDGDFLTVRRLIEDGTLGEIHSFESHFDRWRPQVRERWRESAVEGGGLLYDLGPHLIDQALQLFGSPQTVFADLQCQRAGARAVDYVHLVLGYDELRVILHASTLVRAPSARFTVQGSAASFVKTGLDTQESALLRGLRPDDSGWGQDDDAQYGQLYVDGQPRRTVPTLPGCYESFYRQIAAAIHGKGVPPVTAQDGVAAVRIVEAAMRSAHERSVIDLVP